MAVKKARKTPANKPVPKSQPGKDPQTGRFLPGNRWWLARSSHGPKPKFDNPEGLWAACLEYFEWVETTPLQEAKVFSATEGLRYTTIPKMRAMTLDGLSLFLDIDYQTWDDWRTSRPDLSQVITRVEKAIRAQKFSGAAADMLNANIIARDLGLTDKQDRNNSGTLTVEVIRFAEKGAEEARGG